MGNSKKEHKRDRKLRDKAKSSGRWQDDEEEQEGGGKDAGHVKQLKKQKVGSSRPLSFSSSVKAHIQTIHKHMHTRTRKHADAHMQTHMQIPSHNTHCSVHGRKRMRKTRVQQPRKSAWQRQQGKS
jgi:hypothetical protein